MLTIPTELREVCPISERRASTLRELAILATEHLDSAQCANGKIAAIDEIVTAAETRQAPP